MGLVEKIEAIKKEPEHIRLRYVWFSVFISMFFIIILWIFSLQVGNTNKEASLEQSVNLNGLGGEIEQQKNTLQQTVKDIQSSSASVGAEMNSVIGEKTTSDVVEKSPVMDSKPNAFPVE